MLAAHNATWSATIGVHELGEEIAVMVTQHTVVGRASHDVPRCERCGSTTLQAFPLVYQRGSATLALRSDTIGVGMDTSDDVGVGGAVTQAHGMSQTMLSAHAAPPSPATARWGGVKAVAVVTVIFALMSWNQLRVFADFLLLAGASIAGWLALREHRRVAAYNRIEYPALVKRWRASALCLVCGHTQRLLLEPES